MKKKTTAGLIVIVAIATIAMFAGCIEEPSSAPTATPQLSTPEPSDESVLYVREVSMECRIMDEYTTVYYSIGSNHNKVVEVEVKICIGDNICNIEDPWISPDTPISAWSYFDSLPEYEEPTVEILREIKH
jgi:hypothetical protein